MHQTSTTPPSSEQHSGAHRTEPLACAWTMSPQTSPTDLVVLDGEQHEAPRVLDEQRLRLQAAVDLFSSHLGHLHAALELVLFALVRLLRVAGRAMVGRGGLGGMCQQRIHTNMCVGVWFERICVLFAPTIFNTWMLAHEIKTIFRILKTVQSVSRARQGHTPYGTRHTAHAKQTTTTHISTVSVSGGTAQRSSPSGAAMYAHGAAAEPLLLLLQLWRCFPKNI